MTSTEESIDTNSAAGTGYAPTFIVAVEQNFPAEQRIIEDSLAPQILSRSNRFMVNMTRIPALRNWMVSFTDKAIQGGWSAFLVRKRYIDERLIEAVAEKQVDAVVNLGAGYDTRLYRLPALQNVPAWEVDQAVNIDAKRKHLHRVLGAIPDHVILVSMNFMEQSVGDVLSEQGYSGEDKTFFIWEAVSQYLTESAVGKMFDFFAKAPAGSRLAFTYVLKDFVKGENFYGDEKFHKQVADIWHFGFDPAHLADFLNDYGWRLIEDLSYEELGNRYVKPTGRQLMSMQIERMVFAEKL
ncbi:MAG: SAM-dependent methyltransferase [Anaerolineales bacterium]|nr:SAM-dependent methyltransferase [Anaerolineales bacterium]